MSINKLKEYAASVNIAHDLSDEQLQEIGQQVLLGYQEDKNSMEDWLADVKRIEDLASLKTKKKSTPIPNAANVKLPLITKACYEFTSRIYPEIIQDGKVVKARVLGFDAGGKKESATRATDFMNYQLLFKDTVWETQLDKLLMRLALVGFICKKTYYDNVFKTIKQVICEPKELIIHADTKSMEEATRITHELHLRINDFVAQKNTVRDGKSVFLPVPADEIVLRHKTDTLNKSIDVLEQCCFLDLDDDGYSEPYIVTVLKENGKVLRIAPRFEEKDICVENKTICYITPTDIYEDYHFLQNPNGSFQSVGFGTLLLHLTEATNTVMNQLLDAGQLANMKCGYMDARLKMVGDGNSLHDQGEFKLIKVMAGASLKDGILPIQYGEPSSVLYQLLSLLIDVSRDLTSSAEINNGTQSSQNAKTGATQALISEGKKTLSSIGKRFYRSLTKELKHIFLLNERYLDPEEYYNVLDDTKAVKQEDFNSKKCDVIPVADPNLASETQKSQEIQILLGLKQSGINVDQDKLDKLILERVAIPGIMEILPDPKAQKPPNPEMLKLQADMEKSAQELHIKGQDLDLKEKEVMIKTHIADADIAVKQAQAALYVAQAEALKSTQEIKQAELELGIVSKHIDTGLALSQQQHEKDLQEAQNANQTQTDGPVAPQPSDTNSPPTDQGA